MSIFTFLLLRTRGEAETSAANESAKVLQTFVGAAIKDVRDDAFTLWLLRQKHPSSGETDCVLHALSQVFVSRALAVSRTSAHLPSACISAFEPRT